MESFYTLLKICLILYFGCFTYLLYQILFYRQKRFLFIKTILFFFCIAVCMIHAINKYHILLFYAYMLFYLLGIYLSRKYLKNMIQKRNKETDILIKPLKKWSLIIFKIITIPPFTKYIKEKRRLHKEYRLYPNHRPKTIYDLF